jgi:hypothetical protein
MGQRDSGLQVGNVVSLDGTDYTVSAIEGRTALAVSSTQKQVNIYLNVAGWPMSPRAIVRAAKSGEWKPAARPVVEVGQLWRARSGGREFRVEKSLVLCEGKPAAQLLDGGFMFLGEDGTPLFDGWELVQRPAPTPPPLENAQQAMLHQQATLDHEAWTQQVARQADLYRLTQQAQQAGRGWLRPTPADIRAANRQAVQAALDDPPREVLDGFGQRRGPVWDRWCQWMAIHLEQCNAQPQPSAWGMGRAAHLAALAAEGVDP